MFLEQRFQISQCNGARHGRGVARHVLGCLTLEKSVHQSIRLVVRLVAVQLSHGEIIFRSLAAVNVRTGNLNFRRQRPGSSATVEPGAF